MSAERTLAWLEKNEQASIARVMDWLRIPSVSTDPGHREDVRCGAEWAAEHLRASGLDVKIMPTGGGKGHPIVLAEHAGAADYKGPHVLFYGHYDVQPPDPIELWESPPFEPMLKPAEPGGGAGERIVARGAVDDKGQVMMFLEALRAWKETTGDPTGGVRMTIMLEGEEECGSANLEQFVEENADGLGKCDVCLISDTGMLARGRPAITYGVRGLAYTEVTLHAADQDLHSGMWGGKCPNPINELAKVLAGLWDEDYRVTIPGFYDDVQDLGADERAAWRELGLDAAKSLASIGLPPEADVGEKGYSATEREWARPTADMNGIFGGYTGPGAKTVIPSHATAKVSFRLVANQDPEKITNAFFDWLRGRTPPGCRWEFVDHGGGYPATVATDSPTLSAARRAVQRATGQDTSLIKTGGSIPVAGILKARLGLDTIFMGFGLEDDRVHSPNEKFELECFRWGARSHAVLIEELRQMAGA